MTTGPNNFKVKVDRTAINEIVVKMQGMVLPKTAQSMSYSQAHAYFVLRALTEFLEERKCQPDFEVVLGE